MIGQHLVLATLPEAKTISYGPTPEQRSVQLLAFRRQGSNFALPMSAVRELTVADDIVTCDSGTRLKGVCTIGSTVVPLLDLVRHSSVALWESAAQLIVVSVRSQWIGLVYDQIVEVCPVLSSRIASASLNADTEWPRLELNHRQTSYLDPARLVRSPELALLDSVTGALAYELVG